MGIGKVFDCLHNRPSTPHTYLHTHTHTHYTHSPGIALLALRSTDSNSFRLFCSSALPPNWEEDALSLSDALYHRQSISPSLLSFSLVNKTTICRDLAIFGSTGETRKSPGRKTAFVYIYIYSNSKLITQGKVIVVSGDKRIFFYFIFFSLDYIMCFLAFA